MLVRVKVWPGAKKEAVLKKKENELEIFVREGAVRNQANDRTHLLVARHFGVLPKEVKFVSGARSRNKIFDINRRM